MNNYGNNGNGELKEDWQPDSFSFETPSKPNQNSNNEQAKTNTKQETKEKTTKSK